ncbi:MAG: hypothetical protein M3Y87_10770 [Myxococcota bacterium]|nr:hypothetical protein [Myxococcota bacterium]
MTLLTRKVLSCLSALAVCAGCSRGEPDGTATATTLGESALPAPDSAAVERAEEALARELEGVHDAEERNTVRAARLQMELIALRSNSDLDLGTMRLTAAEIRARLFDTEDGRRDAADALAARALRGERYAPTPGDLANAERAHAAIADAHARAARGRPAPGAESFTPDAEGIAVVPPTDEEIRREAP